VRALTLPGEHNDMDVLMTQLPPPLFFLETQAKHLQHKQRIHWQEALNQIAEREGFPSWSKLQTEQPNTTNMLREALCPGDMAIISSCSRDAKLFAAMKLLLSLAQDTRQCYFFTLECYPKQVLSAFEKMGARAGQLAYIHCDCYEDINANYILDVLEHERTASAFVVIDYLQLLDQKRNHPPLSKQLKTLHMYAKETHTTFLFISQLDRFFEGSGRDIPRTHEVRAPNPIDIKLFDHMFFLPTTREKDFELP